MAFELLLTALVNAAVGLLIGWSGIAGFLLPMFYVGVLGLEVPAALTLSFAAFAVSGAIGAAGYYKQGNLPVKAALPLGLGSLAGAVLGVALNALIPPGVVKVLLYVVVLASGTSILLRERCAAKAPAADTSTGKTPLDRPPLAAGLGFATAVICALSGAGGPVLVMPLLVLLGLPVRWAIGVALFDSIFIALPSVVGYGLQTGLSGLWPLLAAGCLAHAAGVLIGSRTCGAIPQRPLKIAVAVFSILIALYMIFTMLL
ncbi:sulfite exporter TauE/SafE family protein [Ruminococcaceae bacterium OttesenSCG-928-A11]|nr:sulfite exporter TauE/SafE family protein [Ruminococcaceae bacterium OttesenSCG-928-A11]